MIKVQQINDIVSVKQINEVVKVNLLNNSNTIITDNGNGYIQTSFIAGDVSKEIGVVPLKKLFITLLTSLLLPKYLYQLLYNLQPNADRLMLSRLLS